jgi:hypothetical protein
VVWLHIGEHQVAHVLHVDLKQVVSQDVFFAIIKHLMENVLVFIDRWISAQLI